MLHLPRRPGGEPGPDLPPDRGWGPGQVTVSVRDFMEGRFPALCVLTGRPATTNLRHRVWMRPGWVSVLAVVVWAGVEEVMSLTLPLRVLPVLVLVALFSIAGWAILLAAIWANKPSASGTLPLSAAVAERVRARHLLAVQLAVGGAMALVAATAVALIMSPTSDSFRVALALAVTAAALLAASAVSLLLESRALGVRTRLIRDSFGDRWVQLRRVHPGFSAALAAQLRARRSA